MAVRLYETWGNGCKTEWQYETWENGTLTVSFSLCISSSFFAASAAAIADDTFPLAPPPPPAVLAAAGDIFWTLVAEATGEGGTRDDVMVM